MTEKHLKIAEIYSTEDGCAEILLGNNLSNAGRIAYLDILQDMISDLQMAYDWILANKEADHLGGFFRSLPDEAPNWEMQRTECDLTEDCLTLLDE